MDRIDELFPRYDNAAKEPVRKAYELACKALEGKARGNGEPFILHPENVARIADKEIGLPPECIAAVFLHEACTQGKLDRHSLDNSFGRDILEMVDGLEKISSIKPKDTRLEAENYKKLIVSYSTDPRVTILKLADRLEVMRSLEIFPKASRERKILESLMLYIPLAHQLGLYNMKSEMEDIYFRYAGPEQYRAITNKLKATEKDRQNIALKFIGPLKQKLDSAGIAYKLKARTKTAYSIWKKMQNQKVDFDGVYDVFAMRFIINCDLCAPVTGDDGKILEGRELEHALCWKVFSYVTEEYESDTNRLRDWISNPKPNGYESLHITVRNSDGAFIEVQIRTVRMDDMAENGLASHWSYKGIKRQAALDSWLAAVRNSLENGSGGSLSPSDSGRSELPHIPESDVFVFTPSGELRKLTAGATVLDFAFDIHSNLGVKCVGGRINGKAVSFKEKIHTGDVVEIMSGKNQRPSADWLNICVTSKARTKIKQKIKEYEFAKAADGKELFERRMKNWKMEVGDDELAELLKKLQIRTLNEFFQKLGEEELDIADVRDSILAAREKKENAQSTIEEKKDRDTRASSRKSSDDILVIDAKNVRGLDYKLSKCCNPVFGDDVFGFVTIKEGVKIHRISCPNAARLIERYPYRIQKVRWSDTPSCSSFQTALKIVANMEPSVINELMDVINSFKASVRGFNVSENERNGCYDINIRISVSNNLELDKVVSQIRILKNVIKVSRS